MGRQQYLSRLALGRSAFADVPGDGDQHEAEADAAESPAPDPDPRHTQQYDAKGRPFNPATDDRNAALRNAENAALALVGVVKRKDNIERITELKYRHLSEIRAQVLEAEQNAGEDLETAVTLLSSCNYAIETLVRRAQAGLYSSTDSFASILQNGLAAISHAGLGGALAILFPGAPASLVYNVVRVLIGASLSTGFEYLSLMLIRQKLRKKTIRRAHRGLYFVCEAVLICLDVALLPLEHYAYAQRLGLAPTWPLLPSWRILLPSNATSFHQFGWHSHLTTIPILQRLCSPAALMLLHSTIWREQDAEVPIASQLTRFQYPDHFHDSLRNVYAPNFSSDPFGWLLSQGYRARVRFMRFLGYKLKHSPHRSKYEQDRLPLLPLPDSPPDDGLHHGHRSTTLAHLAPEFLANRLDLAFAKTLLLPLQILVARTVAQSYLASPLLPKTPFALSLASQAYSAGGSWSDTGSYLSKIGLGLSLHAANTAGTFFVVWALSTYYGRHRFDWGVKGEIGGVPFPTGDEE